ncbi:FG-nucleoporin nsp1 [Ceratobasidium sp. 392]|nr:FG-nucleoporin nsp1 [Ceratobasidium sp. 392]
MPVQVKPTKPNLFGAAPAATGGGLFGASATPAATGATTAPKPLFGFGAPATGATAATPAAASTEAHKPGGLFGSTPSALGTTTKPSLFSTPAATSAATTDAAKPATGLFGAAAPATSTNTTISAAPKPFFGLGTTPAAPSSASTTDANKPAGGLFGATPAVGFAATTTPSLGGLFAPKPTEPAKPVEPVKPADAAKPTETTATPAPSLFGPKPTASGTTPAAPSGGLFGLTPAAKDDSKKDPAKPDAAAPTATSSPFGGGLFAPKPAAANTTSAATTTTAVPTTAIPAATTTTVPAQAVPPSALRGKSVEEIVNKWQEELETQTKEFKRTAQEVEVWDRALIDNGIQISHLYAAVQNAEAMQQGIDGTLDNIEEQQKSVAAALDGYEHEMKKIYGSESLGVDVGPADGQREKNYALAASLADQLDSLARGLSTMIDSVNDLSTGTSSAQSKDDPVAQISAILNAHLESLQWIDGAVRDAEERVKDVEGTRGNNGGTDGRGALGMSLIGGVGSGLGGRATTQRSGRYGL